MIAIVISEKGGAERREQYGQNEITIGRVKGNDVLLPKGNVSKRHARLIVRDGRYIVTDLKSTNGTYVNHRRITHATLVREGDRIYIGDFVLRIEGDGPHASSSSAPASYSPDSGRTSTGRHPAASGIPLDRTHAPGPREDVVSHFPIEHDPDDSSPQLDVPAAPRVPSGLRSAASPLASSQSFDGPHTSEQSSPSNPASLGLSEHTPQHGLRSSQPVSIEHEQRSERMLCLEQLVEAVEAIAGVEALEAIEPDAKLREAVEKTLEEQLTKLREEGSLPNGVESTPLREAAREELFGMGPLGALLDDDNITQVQVLVRHLSVQRRGRRVGYGGFDFATEAGVGRALARLCARMGIEPRFDGPYLEAPLDGGRRLLAVLPGASPSGHLLLIERPHRARASLDGLVRSGAISRGMATLLAHCIAARANVLVVGAQDSGAPEIVDALVGAVPRDARAIWLFDEASRDSVPEDAASIDLGSGAEAVRRAIETAARVGPDHLVVPPLSGEALATLLDAITRGAEGVVLRIPAATLRHALDRVSADLAHARPGLSPLTAREWLGSAFDLGLEVTRLRDGRPRVVRLAELRGGSQGVQLRDVFTFAYHRTAAGGSIEGTFYASGTVPRLVEDLAARGMPLDTTIFRRHPAS
jgi:pilus assembly protein CpaF